MDRMDKGNITKWYAPPSLMAEFLIKLKYASVVPECGTNWDYNQPRSLRLTSRHTFTLWINSVKAAKKMDDQAIAISIDAGHCCGQVHGRQQCV